LTLICLTPIFFVDIVLLACLLLLLNFFWAMWEKI
jgi:hypothetical protein